MTLGVSNSEKRSLILRVFSRYDDTKLIVTVFWGMLVGVAATLYIDYKEMRDYSALSPQALPRTSPMLPAAPASREVDPDGVSNAPPVKVDTPVEQHRAKMKIQLVGGGVLKLTGTIEEGSAEEFSAKIETVGEYVKVVVVDSPGGALNDAVAISNSIRKAGFKTKIAAGGLCASACPVLFAGGVERDVSAKSAFGLHQVYTKDLTAISAAQAMSEAQATTAMVTRHLEKMNVDPAVWTLALETPPAQLYYLSQDELRRFKFISNDEETNGD